MGTRADFYVGKGKDAEWIGSIAWDGYRDGIDDAVLQASSVDAFRSAVAKFFVERDDVTLPMRGWPWPWKTSATTDCSYWFFDGQVWDEDDDRYASCSADPDSKPIGDDIDYPVFDTDRFARDGQRSGLIVVTKRADGTSSVS